MTSNMAAILILLLVVAKAGAEPVVYDKTESNGLDSKRNCTTEYDNFFSHLNIKCLLPSGTVSIAITKLGWIEISCHKNNALVCDELQEFKSYLDGYVPPKVTATEESQKFLISLFEYLPANTTTAYGQLGSIKIDHCDITRIDTRCLPKLFAVTGFSNVILRGFRGQLQPAQLQRIMSAADLTISYDRLDAKTDAITIPYNVLSLLPKLKAYTMSGPLDMFLELHSDQKILRELTYLKLKSYTLRALKKGSFENVPNLEMLKLERNKIEFIDRDAFQGLNLLKSVDLVGNDITQLPGELFRYSPYMREINIKYNKLMSDHMTEELSKNLQESEEDAILEETEENETPRQTKEPNVKEPSPLLKLTSVDFFFNLTNLRIVSLYDNNIKIIPSKLFSHVLLTYLDLSLNNIEYLPADIFIGQATLEELNLSQNKLKSLPEGIFLYLGSLKTLNLGRNMLQTLDISAFSGLKSLRRLSLYYNKIQHIDHQVFDAVPQLEYISLVSNNLTISREKNTRQNNTMYESPLSGLHNLREIDLHDNKVSIICDDWKEKKQLQKLILFRNNFTSFTDLDWEYLRASNLSVDLRLNHIRLIQSSKLYSQNITFLLENNPYDCDCMLYEFIVLHKKRRNMRGGLLLGDAKCSQPKNLSDKKLIDLNSEDDLTCNIKCPRNSEATPVNCYSCTERPSKSRVEMICKKFPDIYPNLRKGYNSIHIKLEHASNIPSLPPQVKFIDLSNLSLTEPPVARAVEMNLTYNNLTRAPIAALKGNCTLHLRHNPFVCSCEGKNDIVMLQKYRNQITDYNFLTCSDNNFVSNVDTNQLCGVRDGLVVGCSIISIGLALAVIIAVVYKYRRDIRILLRKYDLWCWKDKQDALYDAYISYAPKDEAYVKTHMIPTLESGRPPLRLCLPDRHWPIGGLIPELITESVEQSHRTVIVLSEDYLAYGWRSVELKTAFEKEKIIIFMLDDLSDVKSLDPEIRRYIAMSPVFKAEDRLVYEKIRRRILKSQKIKNSNIIKLQDEAKTGRNRATIELSD